MGLFLVSCGVNSGQAVKSTAGVSDLTRCNANAPCKSSYNQCLTSRNCGRDTACMTNCLSVALKTTVDKCVPKCVVGSCGDNGCGGKCVCTESGKMGCYQNKCVYSGEANVCGNGIIETNEICDDGVQYGGSSPSSEAKKSCNLCTSIVSIEDNDPTNDFYVKGKLVEKVTSTDGKVVVRETKEDLCSSSLNKSLVAQFTYRWFGEKGKWDTAFEIDPVNYVCPAGTVCTSGVCVAPPAVCGNGIIEGTEECEGNVECKKCRKYLCNDSDGMNPLTLGIKYNGYISSGDIYNISDFCPSYKGLDGIIYVSKTEVREFYCDNLTYSQWKDIPCPTGTTCQDGACAPPKPDLTITGVSLGANSGYVNTDQYFYPVISVKNLGVDVASTTIKVSFKTFNGQTQYKETVLTYTSAFKSGETVNLVEGYTIVRAPQGVSDFPYQVVVDSSSVISESNETNNLFVH